MHSDFINVYVGEGQSVQVAIPQQEVCLSRSWSLADLNGFESSTDFVLGGVRIGMGCMKVVIVIAWYTWVPVTLSMLLVSFRIIGSRSGLAKVLMLQKLP